jgi:predicted metal-dependent HD superfamily phosphohydrolase
MNLQERFTQTCFQLTQDQNLIEIFWVEIKEKYSEKGRYYHNIQHLENMFSELDAVKDQIENFTNISFSVFYHDVIYEASSKNNEEKSAEFAKSRLEKLNCSSSDINSVFEQIIATKAHQKADDKDICYLLDADLSILGKNSETYIDYTKKIRKEYSIYPDLLYQPGRKKVLHHFLELENIFKTKDFKAKYENQARKNIEAEIQSL